VVALSCDSVLDTTIAMFISLYSLTLIGPSLANVPLANPLLATFATAAAPSVPIILDLFASTVLLMLLTPSDNLPSNAICNDSANPVLCASDKAVPASIALTLNDLRVLLRGALRLAAMQA
jgi:hypothetical protein